MFFGRDSLPPAASIGAELTIRDVGRGGGRGRSITQLHKPDKRSINVVMALELILLKASKGVSCIAAGVDCRAVGFVRLHSGGTIEAAQKHATKVREVEGGGTVAGTVGHANDGKQLDILGATDGGAIAE